MPNENGQVIPRATGLLLIEVRNSNPNGDPDQESDPRRRGHDDRGLITAVSFKRKLRDLVLNKDGEVWKQLGQGFASDEFDVLESRGHKWGDIDSLLKKDFIGFQKRFWDGRLFGNTFLEKGGEDTIRSGVAHFGLAVSVAPIRVERLTMTKMAPAQKGKEGEKGPTRGMAPLGYRVVEHGVYLMPFFINPTAASRTGCTPRDVGLMLRLIPYAYPHTRSHIRPFVEVRHAWYAEHSNSLGSFSEFRFIEAMTPKRKGENPDVPSTEWDDYAAPTNLPDDLAGKVQNFCDLCEALPPWTDERVG